MTHINVDLSALYLPYLQYGLPDPISLLRADNNLPPWRAGLKEVPCLLFDVVRLYHCLEKSINLLVTTCMLPFTGNLRWQAEMKS